MRIDRGTGDGPLEGVFAETQKKSETANNDAPMRIMTVNIKSRRCMPMDP